MGASPPGLYARRPRLNGTSPGGRCYNATRGGQPRSIFLLSGLAVNCASKPTCKGGIAINKLLVLTVLMCTGMGFARQSAHEPTGVASLTRLDRLPLLRRGVWFHSTSSQDVTGGNDDGFHAAFSDQYVRDGRYVLLDTLGPACIQLFRSARFDPFRNRMSFDGNVTITTQTDGHTRKEVLPFDDLYSGRQAPFLAPLVRNEKQDHGSAWNFVPICSEGPIKVSTDKPGPFLFYDIFYDTYAPGVSVKAFSPRMDVRAAIRRWEAVGQPFDRRAAVPSTRVVNLPSDTSATVWSSSQAGTVTAIRVKLGKVTARALRHVRIKAYWDGETRPSVDCPLGPFFGTGYWPLTRSRGAKPRQGFTPTKMQKGVVELGRIATRSLPVGAGQNGFYNLFPMPYFKSARIILANDSDQPVNRIKVTVDSVAGGPPASSGYFHAWWHEENPTRMHRDYTVLETRGHGQYVGAVLVMSSVNYSPARIHEVQRLYLEGDARFYIDGNRTMVNAGTGTEEYFMWGGYDIVAFDKVFSYAANGYPFHDIDAQDHSVMYRFHLGDLVPYYRSFRFELEHGPEGNVPSNYSSTAFYYQVNTPALEMTDQVDPADSESEKSHAYSPGKVVWRGCRNLPFEGDRQIVFDDAYKADLKYETANYLSETLHACGQRSTGAIRFTAAVLRDNQGIKLRRLLDYAPRDMPGQQLEKRPRPLIAPGEKALVFVDGRRVGEWYTPPRHARLAWLEDDFEIPEQFTKGKRRVEIRLQVEPGTTWSAFQYRVYSYRGMKCLVEWLRWSHRRSV
jgi:D-arabinan exo alpha-(1,3)/(1,5)-arabinofuranosidase (non-reducing end)